MDGPPEHISNKLKAIGSVFNPEVVSAVYEMYLPLLRQAPKEGVEVIKNISYGPNERHLLDIHLPEKISDQGAPTVVYFHGGGFVRGNKNAIENEPDIIHGNIANFFARNGIIGVNATYRLAPQYKWPSGGEDVELTFKFLSESSQKYKINKDSIFLFGQSAGSTHVSTYIFDKLFSKKTEKPAGAILFSGAYDVSLMSSGPVKEYYGSDESKYKEMSSINYAADCNLPLFIVTSEYDPDIFKIQADELVKKFPKNNEKILFKRLANHNHLSQVIHLNTEDETIGPDLVQFITKYKKD